MVKKKVPTRRTRGRGTQGSLPKGREQQSGRKRGAKRVTEVRPIEHRLAPKAQRAKGQRQSVPLDEGKARRGVRGSKKRGAKTWRKRRQRAASPRRAK